MEYGKGKIQKHFMLTPSDAKLLKELAEENHMNESDYVRAIIRNEPTAFKEVKQQFSNLVYEINKIGNNINQIAKRSNSEMMTSKDRLMILEYQRQIKELLKEVLVQYGYK